MRIRLEEDRLPLRAPVRSACEILGLDPLYVANEGKLLAFVPEGQAEVALAALRACPLGRDATRIGLVEEGAGVEMVTELGTRRSLRMAAGELLPRIC